MRIIRHAFFVIICIAALVGCGSSSGREQDAPKGRTAYEMCVRGVSRTQQGILRICDQINPTTISSVRQALSLSDSEVILTSGGGTSSSAMELGRILRERGVTVRARQFCLSACSTYVLPAAKKVIVEPYTIIAFHHTGAFAIDLLNDRAGAPIDSPSRGLAVAERAYYEEIGMDVALLDRFAVAVEPTCIGYTQTEQGRMAVINYRYNWFVPTKSEIKSIFHERVSGYWPESKGEAEAIIRPTLGDERINVAFGWRAGAAPVVSDLARSLPSC